MWRMTRDAESPSRALLRVEGRVAEGAALLERECFGVLEDWGALILDLAGVNFIDRAGIETLKRLSRAGVVIRCRPGPVADVLEGEDIPVTRLEERDEGPGGS